VKRNDVKGYVVCRCWMCGFFLQVGARNNVSDMDKDPFYNFIQKTYSIHPIMMAVALYALGGFPYIVWGMVNLSTSCFCLLSLVNLTSLGCMYMLKFHFWFTPRNLKCYCVYCFFSLNLFGWLQAVRTVWVYHITWFVNSASHVWGTQSWNTGDLSRNNW